MPTTIVIPAKAGIRARLLFEFYRWLGWIPAFAGMTELGNEALPTTHTVMPTKVGTHDKFQRA